MSVCVDLAWKSLHKYGEELCGDKVERIKTKDADILIVADGMGSGVKANILATLTASILGTMLKNGASIDECVETVAKTLPICKERQVAYATFSILQIFHNGEAYLIEYDNPLCIFIRNNQLFSYPYTERTIDGKKIREYRFQTEKDDCFVLMSDGVIFAGQGEIMNYAWQWEDMASYALKCTKETLSASRLSAMLSQVCYDLYGEKPGDDTTVAVARVIPRRVVSIFTGPPTSSEDDGRIVQDFMKEEGKKVICGGTTANIAARQLHCKIETVVNRKDPSLPPVAKMEKIDLVTEGVLTMKKTLQILKKYEKEEFDEQFFQLLDLENGASKLAKLILEECTDLMLFVGKAMNTAHEDPSLSFELSTRISLIEQLETCANALGKRVQIKYY